jgi:DNA-binding response OmpR family regulator
LSYALGADEYFTKPFITRELVAKIGAAFGDNNIMQIDTAE